MEKDNKELDLLLQSIRSILGELKQSITAMIQQLDIEYEKIEWPTFLDNYAVISSHLISITKMLSKDLSSALLRNFTVLPLKVSPQYDPELSKMTEGRIPIFSHDVLPDYLRTKPIPGAEQNTELNVQKANSLSPEAAMEQVTEYNKIISYAYDIIHKAREEWETQNYPITEPPETSSIDDTYLLCAAIGLGKGVNPKEPNAPKPVGIKVLKPVSPSNLEPKKKALGIKTNIKSGH